MGPNGLGAEFEAPEGALGLNAATVQHHDALGLGYNLVVTWMQPTQAEINELRYQQLQAGNRVAR